jgi:hypothetical protein
MSGLPPGGGGKLFSAALLVIAAVGLAIYAFVAAGDAVSDSAATWTRAAGVVLPLVFLAIAYVLFRKVVPPKARHLKVTLSAGQARRGDSIDARLEVTRAGDDEIEIGLVCTEYYDVEKTSYSSNSGTRHYRDTDDAIAHEEWRPASPSQSIHNVRFQIPPDAPFTFKGDCLAFEWRVSARQPKKMRFDRTSDVDLTVLP